MGLKQAYCRQCRATGPFETTPPNHILHLLITLCTCSIWFWVVWLPLILFGGRANCRKCGWRESSTLTSLIQLGGAVVVALILGIIITAMMSK